MSKWKRMRISLLVFVAIFSSFVSLVPRDSPPYEWDSLVIIFVLVTLAVPALIGLQTFNPSAQKVWDRPGWDTDPFNFREPWHFLHLGSYVLLVQGWIDAARVAISNQSYYPAVLMPLVLGLAALLGIRLALLLFHSKFN